MSKPACLHIQDRAWGPIRVVEIPWLSARIGGTARCEVRLPDPNLTAEVCRLERRLGAWRLVSLGSDVELEVGGKSITGWALIDFDLPFRIGTCVLTLKRDRASLPDWAMHGRAIPALEANDVSRDKHAAASSAPPPVAKPARPADAQPGRWREFNPGTHKREKIARYAKARPPQARRTIDADRRLGTAGSKLEPARVPPEVKTAPHLRRPERFVSEVVNQPSVCPREPIGKSAPIVAFAPAVVEASAKPRLALEQAVASDPSVEPAPAVCNPDPAVPEPTLLHDSILESPLLEEIVSEAARIEASPREPSPVEPRPVEVRGVASLPAEPPSEEPWPPESVCPPSAAVEAMGDAANPDPAAEPHEPGGCALEDVTPRLECAAELPPPPASIDPSVVLDAFDEIVIKSPNADATLADPTSDPPRQSVRERIPARERHDRSEWPSVREVLATHKARAAADPSPRRKRSTKRERPAAKPERSSPNRRPAARITARRPSPTVSTPPDAWRLPLWLGAPALVLMVSALGFAGGALSFVWAADSSAAGVGTAWLLAPADARKGPPPPTARPAGTSWVATTPRHLATYAVALAQNQREAETNPLEPLEQALAIAPIDPVARLVRARFRAQSHEPALAEADLALSRDSVALATSARRLLDAGKIDEARALYRSALAMAAEPHRAGDEAPEFSQDPDVGHFLIPGEGRIRRVLEEMIQATSWKSVEWIELLPESGLARVAAARLLLEQDREEAMRLLETIAASKPGPNASSAELAAHAEALALARRFPEAEHAYQAAIEAEPVGKARRTYWFNLADVELQLEHSAERDRALKSAMATADADAITRKAVAARRLGSALNQREAATLRSN